jgi:hypothetical protein
MERKDSINIRTYQTFLQYAAKFVT